MADYITPQEEFWAGNFGNEYTSRNDGAQRIASNISLFSKILGSTRSVESVIEFGSNQGLNLKALKVLRPFCELAAVEINPIAVKALQEWGGCSVVKQQSILDYVAEKQYDISIIKGVLIHINPEQLRAVYEKLYKSSSRYICIVEYYNPTPVTISYRGHSDRLFKRDFAGEVLDMYPDLKLVDYGFTYRRDNNFSLDDSTWFLLEKLRD